MERWKRAKLPLLFASGYLVTALIALYFTQGRDGIAAAWPPSGFFVAGLLYLDAHRRKILTFAVLAASMAANFYTGVSLLVAVAYSAANLIEGYVVFALMGAREKRPRLSDPLTLLRFSGAALVGGSISAMLAGILSLNFSFVFLGSWATTVTLGMLLVTPLIFFLLEDPKGCPSLLSLKTLWMLGLTCIAAVAGFGQDAVPLIFVPVVAVSIATYLLALRGAALAILVIAAIGSFLTAMDFGPLPLFFARTGEQVLFFQLYLVALQVSALPLAVMLDQRERNLEELASSNRLLRSAEQAANVGHWNYRVGDKKTYWSEEARRIFRLGSDEKVDFLDALEAFDPEDRDRVIHFTKQAIANGTPFSFEARIPSPDGRVRHVECRGRVELDENLHVISVFGTVMDVSERAQAVWSATKSRERAERETQRARELAETDPLTGLPNRRKILDLLQELADDHDPSEELCVAMIDIDHFKSINDTHGHEAGDEVLRQISASFRKMMREEDRVGRLGGEEFLAILPHTSHDEAVEFIDSLRQSLGEQEWGSLEIPSVTFSAGVSAYSSGMPIAEVLRLTDRALYKAKNDGRNKVVAATHAPD